MNGYESDSLLAKKDIAKACKSIAEQLLLLNNRLADMELVLSLFFMENKGYSLIQLTSKLAKIKEDLKNMELKGVKDLIPEETRQKYGIT